MGNFNLALGQSINFGTKQFGINSYDNNLNCGYNFSRVATANSLFALGG